MENFITLDMFLSLAGCITIVTIATQLVKQFCKIDAKWLALLISAIVTAVRVIAIGDYSGKGIIVGIFNIIPILYGAIGGYETIIKPIANKISEKKEE